MTSIWLDIENPPQVRYLLPLAKAFASAGADVLVTARDYGDTLQMLEDEQVEFRRVGSAYGRSKASKVLGLLGRTRELLRWLGTGRSADALVAASRAGALAARRRGIPAYVVNDYEHVDLRAFRAAGSYLLHPDVIPAEEYRRRGIRPSRLMPFRGLKEDISFYGIDFASIAAHDFGLSDEGPRVLFRPPAEASHYFRAESGVLAQAVLRRLAGDDRVRVVFAPREPRQERDLADAGPWANEPVVLRRPIPSVPLLKAVDAVVSSGGTMLREAAYLGVPAASILRSRIGAVDSHLALLGRLILIESPRDLDSLEVRRDRTLPPLASNPRLADEVVARVLTSVAGGR